MKSKFGKANFNETSHRSQLLPMGNGGAKVAKDTSMEIASRPLGKPLPCENITSVEKVLDLKHEVWKLTKLHVKYLEGKRKKLQDHLIGLKFSMDD
jgi:hypothetical protein